MSPASLIRSDLLAALPDLMLGTILLAAGVSMAAFGTLKLKDSTLLYLGLFAALVRQDDVTLVLATVAS